MRKLLLWVLALPIAFVVLVTLTVIELFVDVFNMPTDLWKIINGEMNVTEE